MMLVIGITSLSHPVDQHRQRSHHNSGRYRESEVRTNSKYSSTHSQADVRQVKGRVKGSVEVSCDAWIDSFVEIDFTLLNFSDFLLFFDELKRQQLCVVVFGVGQRLS